MYKRRLLKLADMLEADADNKKGIKFNLWTVVTPGVLPGDATAVPISCGTQACAIGLAALSGAFKRRGGLSYQISRTGDGLNIETTMNGSPMGYDDAAAELFDISLEEADFLFTPSSYPDRAPMRGARGERYVAKRIRDFVDGKIAPKYEGA